MPTNRNSSNLNVSINADGYQQGGGNTERTFNLSAGDFRVVAGTNATITFPTTSGTLATLAGTETFSNKRRTRRVVSVTQSATPVINTDNTDVASITGLAQAITSMTTGLSGTPNNGDLLEIQITDSGTARGITWGASFASTTVTLPTTTVISTKLRVAFEWGGSTWDCIGYA